MICILSLFLHISFQSNNFSLEEARMNYNKASNDKKICEQMIEELETKTQDPVLLAYLGGFQTVWAKHVGSPIAKLSTFKQGRKNIEKSIAKDPNNVELRFIRCSVQKNAPKILGYHSNIKEDIAFIEKNKIRVTSQVVLTNINELLKIEE